jgi:hypothetical protein
MTLDFHALWTLTGVGTVVFATLAASSRRARAATALSYAAAIAAGAWFGPPPAEGAGLLVAGAAVTMLLRPRFIALAPLLGGGLAGLWGAMLAAQDVPLAVAAPVAAIWPIAAAWWARRASFAPPRMRDEALFVLIVLGAAAAVVPGVQEGWRAAVNLSVQSASAPAPASPLPAWTFAVGASALALGGLYSLWSRR